MLVRKIAEAIQLKLGNISRYELAKRLGVSHQVIAHWFNKDPKAVRLEHLCRLRRESGLNWEQLGKLLDREYGKK